MERSNRELPQQFLSSRSAPPLLAGLNPFSNCLDKFRIVQKVVKLGQVTCFAACLAVHYFAERRINLSLIWSRMRLGSSLFEIVHHIGIQKHCHSHLAVPGVGLLVACPSPSRSEDMPTRFESELLGNSIFQLLPIVILANGENSFPTFPI